MPVFCAQAGSPIEGMVTILWSLAAVVLGAVLVGVVAWWFRRRLRAGEDEPPRMGISLSDLRRMRDEGQLTDDEFEAARTTLLAKQRHAQGLAGEDSTDEPADQSGTTSDEPRDDESDDSAGDVSDDKPTR